MQKASPAPSAVFMAGDGLVAIGDLLVAIGDGLVCFRLAMVW